MADDLHELSALYALDVLIGDDRARFEAHLADCDRCRDELQALQATTAQLAYVPEGPAPPAALRDRILVAARADRQTVVPLASRRPRAVAALSAAVAVAACAAAVGLGLWAASLHGSLSHAKQVEAVVANPGTRRVALTGTRGALYVAPTGNAALATGLPALPAGKTYEAWVVGPSRVPQRAAVFAGGTTLLHVRVSAGNAVKVTVERAGGVDAPTTAPIVSTRA